MITRMRCTRAFTLVEVMMSVGILAFTLPASMLAIQWARLRAQDTSLEIISQNMAVSLMEMIKHDYNWITPGGNLPDLYPTTSLSPILNFPAGANPPANPTLPAGNAGNASGPEDYCYLSNGQPSSAIASSTNYLTLSQNQIAALNGYSNASAAGTNPLLNPQMAWGVYIEELAQNPNPPNPDENIFKLVVIIVKWKAHRGQRDRFTTLSTIIGNKQENI